MPVDFAATKTGRWGWAIAWLGVAVGITLRTIHLGRESLWFDEGYTAWMVSHSPAEIIRLIRADTAPPLYYILLHGWTEIFGRSETALRSLSTVFSILTLLLGIATSRRILKNPAAVAVAAWVMSLSYLQIWYAREARAYAMMGFLGVSAFYCLLRHLAARRRAWLIPLPLLIAAAMYTHNMMAPFVAGLLLAWVLLPSEHSIARRMREMAVVIGISLALYLPWALGGLPDQMQMIRRAFWVDPLKARDFPAAIAALTGVKKFWSWTNLLDQIHIRTHDGLWPMRILTLLMIASGVTSIFAQTGARRREAVGLFSVAVFPLALVALFSVVWTPLFTEKLFLPSAALFPIFFLLPLNMRLPRPAMKIAWAGAVILVLLTGLTLFGYHREIHKEDWRAIARRVSDLPARRRLIIFISNDGRLAFDYYYHYRAGDDATGVPGDFFDLNPPRTMRRALDERDLDPLKAQLANGNYHQIVLVLAHEGWADPEHFTRELLRDHWRQAGVFQIRDLAVEWYQNAANN